MRLQNGSLGIGVTPVSSGGSLQLGTGSTNGIGFQSGGVVDARIYRNASGQVFQSGPAATDIIYAIQRSTGETLNMQTASGVCVVGSSSNTPVWLRTNGVQCISLDTSQGVTTAAANYVKTRSVAAAAGTTTLDATDDTAILTGATTQTFTLPAAAAGRRLFVKNRSSGALTVNRAGSDTLDGGTTLTVAAGTAKILIANGTDWCVWNA
jgi:hypothetical protein